MAGLIPYGIIKMRYLLKYCVDRNWVQNQDKCCRSGMAGRFCVYVNEWSRQTYDDNSYDRYNSKLLLDGAKPCDFGYCTDGDANAGAAMPPPPPPFKLPPMPAKPPVPPGKSDTSVDYADYSEYTPPLPPPMPPPPPPTKVRRCRLNR
jgi:hypothetical protein